MQRVCNSGRLPARSRNSADTDPAEAVSAAVPCNFSRTMSGQPEPLEPDSMPAGNLYPSVDSGDNKAAQIPTTTIENNRAEAVSANSPTAFEKKEGRFGKYFSDEEGNLKIVNWVVRCPCCTCVTTIFICLFMTIILFGAIIDGLPFTDEQNAYDVFDVRSKAYDSFRLAQESTTDERSELQKSLSDQKELRQEESIDIIYWIYEAETDGGMFTSKGLDDIKAAESIFLDNADWPDYCVRDHFYPNETQIPFNKTKCARPLSPLTIFYPDEFDEAAADRVMQQLSVQANLDMYNRVSTCIEFAGIPPGADGDVWVNQTVASVSSLADVPTDLPRGCQMLLADLISGSLSLERVSDMIDLMQDINAVTTHWNGEGPKVANPEKMSKFCAYMKQIRTRAYLVDFFFDKEFSVTNPVSMFTRSVLEFGGPRDGFNSSTEDEDKQGEQIKDFVLDELFDDMEKVAKRSNSDETNTFYFMTQLIFDIFIGILIQDTTAAIMSVLFVYFYLWYMLGSLFLASTGMLEILLSLPCAWFIFRGIFQIEYFAGLNALTIFIVAAIGADDIFVFWDAYKQSAHQGPKVTKNLATRMSWVWRKAGLAMAITSATTCCAFLCTVITPLAGTRSFGIFAALVILWDYFLVMSLFCTSVVIYHNRFERPGLCKIPYCCECCTENCACETQDPDPTTKIHQLSFHEGVEPEQDKITRFFSTTFTDFILSNVGRIIIAVVAIAWLIPAVIFVTRLEPTKTAEQFLNEDHPLQYSITIINNEFPQSSENPGLRTYFAWGVDTLDQGGVNQLLDDEFVGEPVFKPDFALTPQCQTKLLEACDFLQYNVNNESLVNKLIKPSDDGFYQVKCFLRSFHEVSEQRGFFDSATEEGVSATNLIPALDSYFTDIPREVEDIDLIQENIGFTGTGLKWVSIELESKELNQWSTLPEDTVREVYEDSLLLRDELDKIVDTACGAKGVLMTDLHQKFVFMNNQRIYRTSAVSGAVIGVVIAFFVLLLATWSFLLSILSTLSILCTIMSVIGVVTMMGWTLGTVEAILISILAGFSVDYVVHLAHAYAGSFGTNDERVRQAFGEMGTPVLSGMLTSVLASLPLFTCQIVFFAKFGTFLCFTILFSWLWANFVFMALIATFGPAKHKPETAAGANFGLALTPSSTRSRIAPVVVSNQME